MASTAGEGHVLLNLLEVSCHKRQAWDHDRVVAITTSDRMPLLAKFCNISGDNSNAIMKQVQGPISFVGVGPEHRCVMVIDREASQKPHCTFLEPLIFVDVEQSHCGKSITVIGRSLSKFKLNTTKTTYNRWASQSS